MRQSVYLQADAQRLHSIQQQQAQKQPQHQPPKQQQPPGSPVRSPTSTATPRILKISPPPAPKTTLKLSGLKSPLQISPKSHAQISPKLAKNISSFSSGSKSQGNLLKSPGHMAKTSGQLLKGSLGRSPGGFPRSHLMLKAQGRRKLLGQVTGSPTVPANGTANSKYERKYRRLKKMVKDMIFVS